jgi:hypothetical protein
MVISVVFRFGGFVDFNDAIEELDLVVQDNQGDISSASFDHIPDIIQGVQKFFRVLHISTCFLFDCALRTSEIFAVDSAFVADFSAAVICDDDGVGIVKVQGDIDSTSAKKLGISSNFEGESSQVFVIAAEESEIMGSDTHKRQLADLLADCFSDLLAHAVAFEILLAVPIAEGVTLIFPAVRVHYHSCYALVPQKESNLQNSRCLSDKPSSSYA